MCFLRGWQNKRWDRHANSCCGLKAGGSLQRDPCAPLFVNKAWSFPEEKQVEQCRGIAYTKAWRLTKPFSAQQTIQTCWGPGMWELIQKKEMTMKWHTQALWGDACMGEVSHRRKLYIRDYLYVSTQRGRRAGNSSQERREWRSDFCVPVTSLSSTMGSLGQRGPKGSSSLASQSHRLCLINGWQMLGEDLQGMQSRKAKCIEICLHRLCLKQMDVWKCEFGLAGLELKGLSLQ